MIQLESLRFPAPSVTTSENYRQGHNGQNENRTVQWDTLWESAKSL
jgi:hypothetical protein